MATKPFTMRLDEEVRAGLEEWAEDDGRTLASLINWILRNAITERRQAGKA